MTKTILLTTLLLCSSLLTASAQVQDNDIEKYHRSSLYSILLKHPEKEYCNEMIEAFKSIPIPDKYNNHDLKIKVMPSPIMKAMTKEEVEGAFKDAILSMLERNKVGGRLVEKWFDRDKTTGAFDMNLVAERGFYDATVLDVNVARVSARGMALLADAGEELIGKTYVIVNDIRYADKETMKTAVLGGLLAAQLVSSFFGIGVDITSVASAAAGVTNKIAGFKVMVTSYLFRLDWNDDIANNFYSNFWMDASNPDAGRKQAWAAQMGKYNLKYIGSATVFSGKTALGGVNSEKDMFLKVCTRAIDKSISELQKSFDEFKVNTPLVTVEPLTAYIGLKEGVDEDSRYEVLEKVLDENGRTTYNKVGEVKPEKGKIWDNRFMASEDKEDGSELKYTTFKKVSGKNFFPGMLLREIK
ncbi:MAG: hypothetical protein IKP84_05895 [Prevotella sp.]|nr:hypothetical protein [Prevotella sp.]